MSNRYFGCFKLKTGGLVFGWAFGLFNLTLLAFCLTLNVFDLIDSYFETSLLNDVFRYFIGKEVSVSVNFVKLNVIAVASAISAFLSFQLINGIRKQNHRKVPEMIAVCISCTLISLLRFFCSLYHMTISDMRTSIIFGSLFGYHAYVLALLYIEFEAANLARITNQQSNA